MEQQLILSGSPHIKSNNSISRIMLDVLIALVPAVVAAVYHFGPGVLGTIALCIASAVGCEALIQYVAKRSITISDLSAVVTGLLLALNLPSGIPWYVPVCGAAFAIIIVKQLFGGLGHNFMNPALAARCFLLISWPVAMTTFLPTLGNIAADPSLAVDGITAATPLTVLAEGSTTVMPGTADLFFGNIPGSLGETSALALIIGFVYLLIRKVITIRIPLAYLGTVAVFALLAGGPEMVLFHLLSGGLLLGAFFMATDYASSPMTIQGQLIFGVGCGVITMVIRLWGGYPEGVSFSILIMNLFGPLLDRAFKDRIFGEVKRVEK